MANIKQKVDTLQKKQWTKFISKNFASILIKWNPNSKLIKSYKNTFFGCADTLIVTDNENLTTTYCKNRWCGVCNRIKTAKAINAYFPQLSKLFDPVFVTLTLPTCTGDELPGRIKEMESEWRLIYQNTKKSSYLKKNNVFKGIRKAECTIRPYGMYHYHFHIILNDWVQAEWLVAQWLHRFEKASHKAQDIRFADETSFKELFKYAFKSEVKTSNENAKRFDLVFNALRNKRTFQCFGGIHQIKEDFEEDELVNGIQLIGQANEIYKWCDEDWYRKSDGLGLVNKPIPQKVRDLIK
jgi:hypothetical protein